jgi:hypothetical protein
MSAADSICLLLEKLPPDVIERFWSKVGRGDESACWPWLGAKSNKGYGNFYMFGSHPKATRVMLSLSLGRPVEAGMQACHKCDNKWCVNPDHLYEGTQHQNIRDTVDRGQHYQANKTHCEKGHPLSGSNLKFISFGWRRCVECHRLRNQRYYDKQQTRER